MIWDVDSHVSPYRRIRIGQDSHVREAEVSTETNDEKSVREAEQNRVWDLITASSQGHGT